MTFVKKRMYSSKKSGSVANKKHSSCKRSFCRPASKRVSVRRNKTNPLQADTTINSNSSPSNLDSCVYRVNDLGGVRTSSAERMKKLRDVKRLKNVILDKSMSEDHQALILHSVLNNPELSNVIKLAGIRINSTFENIAVYNEERRLSMLHIASSKNSVQGRVSDKRRSFIQSQFVSTAPSPIKEVNSPSIYSLIKHNNIPRSTGYRMINAAS